MNIIGMLASIGIKFNKKPNVTSFGSLKVRQNSVISLDMPVFLINNESTIMVDPGESLTVTDIGEFTVLGCRVFRYYCNNIVGHDYFIEVVEDLDGNIGEMAIYSQIDETYPQDQEQLDHIYDQLTDPNETETYITDEMLEYSKLWEDGILTYDENIIPSDKNKETYVCDHESMLYARTYDDSTNQQELLLISIEEQKRVCTYVGLRLSIANIIII